MEPSAIAVRLASAVVAPLARKLFVKEEPGAALVPAPTRISALVSFRGEKRTLTTADLERLALRLVQRANKSSGPYEAAVPGSEEQSTAHAVAGTLGALGDIGMTDVQAVALGHEAFARQLRTHAPPSAQQLTAAATGLYEDVLDIACLHILDFFTKRSTFAAHTAVEQTRRIDQLVRLTDLIAERLPSRTAEDARFEQKYAEHIARKHSELTIYGLDLDHAREWRLDSAYISLEATHDAGMPLPAEQALAGQDRVLLRGGAGSGKTTLVQWLAVTTARQSTARGEPLTGHLSHLVARVPFVLPLRRAVREGLPPTPDRFLHAVRSTAAGAQPDGWADRVLRAGRGLLLIDGIDEVPEPEREETRRWMRELMGDFPGNLWLVTSRPSAVRDDWLSRADFTELTLSPMSRADVAAFTHRWHEAAEADPGRSHQLLALIRTNGDLSRLAVNPLMCGLLCALHRERHGVLPRGRKNLYDAALSMLLERRDLERGVPGDGELNLSKEARIQLLQKLAHWMIRNDRAEMEQSDAVAQLERALTHMAQIDAPPDRVFRHLLNRSGLLREPAHGRVDFVHRTFQDYLAAKAAVEEGDFPLLVDNAHRDQWEDVVRMAVAHARPAERARILRGLIASRTVATGPVVLLEDAADAVPFRNVLLATACLEGATELDPAVHAEITAYAGALLPPRDNTIALLLGESGGPLVLGMLPGPEEVPHEQAHYVVTAASRIATYEALAFLSRYRDHPSLAVRRQLAWAWARFDTDEYADEILRHLDDTDLYFTAHDTGHLDALRRLGGRARIQYTSTYEPHDLTGRIDPGRLTHLWLRGGYRTDGGEDWLSSFPHLHTLVVPHPPAGAEAMTIPGHITVVGEESEVPWDGGIVPGAED